jgi:hypothetical protein
MLILFFCIRYFLVYILDVSIAHNKQNIYKLDYNYIMNLPFYILFLPCYELQYELCFMNCNVCVLKRKIFFSIYIYNA